MTSLQLPPAEPATAFAGTHHESFWDAQRRFRNASWRYTAFCALATAVMGVSLSAVISPLLYAVGILVLDLVNFVVPTPDVLHRASTGPLSSAATATPHPSAMVIAAAVALFLLPGALFMVLTWLAVRVVFRHDAAGGALLGVDARAPRRRVLAERQLTDLVEEIALAGGLPTPDVKLIDAAAPNAAAVGRSYHDATVVVTTGLLDRLDRYQTRAVVADVMASAVNGDLAIGTTIASLYQAIGLVGTAFMAFGEPDSRQLLGRLLRVAARRDRPEDRAAVLDSLAALGSSATPAPSSPVRRRPISIVTAPFALAGGSFLFAEYVWSTLLLNPPLKHAWRARRYLGDATAVRLTRDPESLAKALAAMDGAGAVVPGPPATSHLFLVGPGDHGAGQLPLASFHAPMARRLARLEKMGARHLEAAGRSRSRAQTAVFLTVYGVFAPVWALLVALMIASVVVLTAAGFLIDLLFVFVPLSLLHHVLRQAAH